MEHESFEDTAIAKIMNENFVCIKVDREERPDIDQIYMNAVQLMTGRGGWPLNCFATPDGRPFYGGTYFPKDQWKDILLKLSELYDNDLQKVEEYANKLTNGVKTSELIEKKELQEKFTFSILDSGIEKWKSAFDHKDGGNDQAPKFPIPNNYQFLLQYFYHSQDKPIKDHLELSLKKMAFGGIYDQIGGGFARYSTDMEWKVPHFEKMLYDNAQLISLYSEAYRLNQSHIYKQVVEESIQFVERELMDKSGAFYSALDADSEGEEGKYYVWQKDELKNILGSDFKIAAEHFNLNLKGLWEHGNYILLRDKSDQELADKAEMELVSYREKIEEIKSQLLQLRQKRIKPGLDDKSLTSWNALMIKGLCDSYLSFGKEKYLNFALKNADFILGSQLKKDGGLFHNFKDGKSSINGYLEDYCFSIEAFIALYECTFDEKWLNQADLWAQYCLEHFYDKESGMFYFTSDEDADLIARKTEVGDNVIPSSNSSMAKGLHLLGTLLEKPDYLKKSRQMLSNMSEQFSSYLPGASNWGILQMRFSKPFYEVAVVGKEAKSKVLELQESYQPNKLLIGSFVPITSLPLLEGKWQEGQTTIYVCENKTCQLPVTEVSKAASQIKAN
jgi:uncharacterized protein YyaL (SSP411 family)